MSIFGKLLKTGFDVILLPVEAAKDVVTLGGVVTDKDQPYTVKKLKHLGDDIENIRDELDDL